MHNVVRFPRYLPKNVIMQYSNLKKSMHSWVAIIQCCESCPLSRPLHSLQLLHFLSTLLSIQNTKAVNSQKLKLKMCNIVVYMYSVTVSPVQLLKKTKHKLNFFCFLTIKKIMNQLLVIYQFHEIQTVMQENMKNDADFALQIIHHSCAVERTIQ